ncbi:hypothetical protein ACWGF3_17825 [Streptomyces xanthophaeus]
MTAGIDPFGHLESHKWLGRKVRDIPSGTEGELAAVVQEERTDHNGRQTGVRLAYIRKADGHELSTAVGNVELA